MTSYTHMLDELRLRYAEDKAFIAILTAKGRPDAEVRLKNSRLELLKEIGAEFALFLKHEAAIKAMIGVRP